MKTAALKSNHVELKKKILDAAISKHQTVIDDFRLAIKNMLDSVVGVHEDEMDLSQLEFNAEMTEKSNQLADQLAFANEEMKVLYDMTATIASIHNTVQLGSVVETDRIVFFVSISIADFETEGIQCFGLSTESQLFKVMDGMKNGDRFSYNYSEYTIIDIY
jgi:hypothetical protein